MAKTIIGQLYCGQSTSNTGLQNCIIDPKNFEDIIFIPTGTELTPAQVLALTSTTNAALINDTPSLRWYPINDLVGVEDKSTEYTMESAGYGGQFYGQDGKQFFLFQHKSSLTMHRLYRAFHQMQNAYDCLFIDRKNKVIVGVSKGANFGGFNLENIIVPDWKLNTGNAAQYFIGIALQDSTEWNDSINFIKLPSDLLPNSIRGLKQTEIKATGTGTFSSSRIATIQIRTPHGNLYSAYKTQIAATNGAVIKCYNASTGSLIANTTCVADDVLEQFTLTISATNFPSTAGDEIIVKFGPVSDLISGSIPGFSDCELTMQRA